MPGPLIDEEKAQIIDHLGYANVQYNGDYVFIWVQPILDSLEDEAKLTIIRSHLTRLNNLYTQLDSIVSKFKLDEVKGIKFNNKAEKRLWTHYSAWVTKLAVSLDVKPNPTIYKKGARRII